MNYTTEKIERLPDIARPQGDSEEEQQIKYEHHRFANSTLGDYIKNGEYLAAFTVAFSLLEDRLRAMAIVKQRDVLGHTNFISFATVELSRVVAHNYPTNDEENIFVYNLKAVLHNRNKLLHEAMWRNNVIKLVDIDHVMHLRDIVAADLRRMKREIKINK